MITILHDPLSAASRDFLTALGVTIPEGDDVTVIIGADTVRVISDHAAAVTLCPAFPGYPTAVAEVDGVQYQLAFPTSWDAAAAWAANPVPATTVTTTMTINAFLKRFTMTEKIAIQTASEQANDVGRAIRIAQQELFGVKEWTIDLSDADMVAYMHLLSANDIITVERMTTILTP